jgi:hypothetical protein
MTPTPHIQAAALLLHRERIQDALRNATLRQAAKSRRARFPRMSRSPLLKLA